METHDFNVVGAGHNGLILGCWTRNGEREVDMHRVGNQRKCAPSRRLVTIANLNDLIA